VTSVHPGQEEALDRQLGAYCRSRPFRDASRPQPGNPYRRPIAFAGGFRLWPEGGDACPVGPRARLLGHRVLFNIYEQDLMFLPRRPWDGFQRDFSSFYDPALQRVGQKLRNPLEVRLFDLTDGSDLTAPEMWEHFDRVIAAHERDEGAFRSAILGSADPERAVRNFLVQCAGDFLTEASAMARNLPGTYGEVQSELFKVFIDEYGYGVHPTKHSTLYEALLRDVGMDPSAHAYWHLYLTTSLAVHNYIHLVSQNHRYFFRYLGALYYAEATYSHTCAIISGTIREAFGRDVDTRYFDEHVHIDRHHSRMVRDKLIHPILAGFGDLVVSELCAGFDEFRDVLETSGSDFLEHLRFVDAETLRCDRDAGVRAGSILRPTATGALDVCDSDVVYTLERGDGALVCGLDCERKMMPGEPIRVPGGRMHGFAQTTPDALVRVEPVS